MKRISIAVSPLSWTNDDMPELGGETKLDTMLSEARAIGYEGTELGNKFPRDAHMLSPTLKMHGLQLASGWYSSKLLEWGAKEERRAIEPHLTLLKAMGCKAMVFAECSGSIHGRKGTPLSQRPTLDKAGFQRLGKEMSEMGKFLADQGLKLSYHHHMGTVVETESDVNALMENTTNDVWLLLDTGHLYFAGADPTKVAQTYGKRIGHVHFKDVRKDVLAKVKAKDMSFLDAVLEGVYTVPGDGAVDYPSVCKALKAADYSGWVVMEAEQDPKKAPSRQYAELGFNNIKKYLTDAGLL